jgi:hypothetical protein
LIKHPPLLPPSSSLVLPPLLESVIVMLTVSVSVAPILLVTVKVKTSVVEESTCGAVNVGFIAVLSDNDTVTPELSVCAQE